ncbi:MAG: DUF6220 domain-containing protein [Nocardioidaceae bacterium]
MTSSNPPAEARTPAPLAAYRWALILFLLLGVVQFFLAGLGVWGIDQRKLADASSLDPHRIVGEIMGLVALIAFVIAFFAHVGTRVILLTLLLAVLTSGVQMLLAGLGDHAAVFGGLHALNGLVVMGLAGFLQFSIRPRTARS